MAAGLLWKQRTDGPGPAWGLRSVVDDEWVGVLEAEGRLLGKAAVVAPASGEPTPGAVLPRVEEDAGCRPLWTL